MFFYAAKIIWFVVQPSNALALLLGFGIILLLFGARRLGGYAIILAALGILIVGFSPLGNILIQPLEDRFAQQSVNQPGAPPVTGIVLLGGGLETLITTARRTPALNEAGDRLTTFAALARAHPEARLILSGGIGGLLFREVDEAEVGAQLLAGLGIDPDRLELEDKSRDTYENAQFSRQMANPQTGDRWLLVTSAFHIPRAVGCFQAAGFQVEAFPTDYRTRGPEDWRRGFYAVSEGLRRTDLAAREWVGLIVYFVTGRTETLLPAPG
jgi:uncharacterized SAM-binding protein YcdF (DUF218 family)